jgi:pyridoxal phosphate enzyme (YggS family)
LAQINVEFNLGVVCERIDRACRRAGRSPAEVTLIAVTKTVQPTLIEAAFEAGARYFGENRVQEAAEKIEALSHLRPRPAWHMIGHLQSNKIKPALELFDAIQSIDTVRLGQAVSRRADKKVTVLLEVNVAGEKTKSGFSSSSIIPAFDTISHLPNIEIKGLMTVAPQAISPEQVRPVFKKLRLLADALHLEQLSMGMTDDFEVAIEEGATMVRIGRAIFGERK